MLTTEPGLARNFLNIAFAGFGVLVTVLIAVALGGNSCKILTGRRQVLSGRGSSSDWSDRRG